MLGIGVCSPQGSCTAGESGVPNRWVASGIASQERPQAFQVRHSLRTPTSVLAICVPTDSLTDDEFVESPTDCLLSEENYVEK